MVDLETRWKKRRLTKNEKTNRNRQPKVVRTCQVPNNTTTTNNNNNNNNNNNDSSRKRKSFGCGERWQQRPTSCRGFPEKTSDGDVEINGKCKG